MSSRIKCDVCEGKGKLPPVATSLASAAAIEAMSASDRARFAVTCPVCEGTGRGFDAPLEFLPAPGERKGVVVRGRS